jgi:1-acyl-sn-glycerol-3-phosphate acyltransferase
MAEQYTIKVPRRLAIRSFWRAVGRVGLALLTDTRITGEQNMPTKGPALLVGNHIAMIETLLMIMYSPLGTEMLAAGDVPLEPPFAPLIHSWGVLQINRGNVDRQGMEAALDVLKQGGILGIFPEGGVWDTTVKQARTGVAWLSMKGNAPIIPIGFGGLEGAFAKIARLQRPRLTMNIGEALPPVTVEGRNRKTALEDAANAVMRRIEALMPEDELLRARRVVSENFDFEYNLIKPDGTPAPHPVPTINHGVALSRFFHRPILLDVLSRNLKRPVGALQNLERDGAALAAAAQEYLNYLERDNPQFLNYRFGYETGSAMKAGLEELRDLGRWAAEHGYEVDLRPIRRYRLANSENEVVEDRPGARHEI